MNYRTVPRHYQHYRSKKITTAIFLSLIFVILLGIAVGGVQWFSNSLEGLLISDSFAAAGLQTSVENIAASVQVEDVPGQNPVPLRSGEVSDFMPAAQGAISVELTNDASRVLFSKNEEKRMPIASLTKLMTAAIVLDHYDLSQRVVITPQAMELEGGSNDLQLGQTFTIKDLLYIMLIESSNRAAYSLAEYIGTDEFVAAMNGYAQNMNLANTHFSDMTGLDSGSYSTAKDLVVLTQYLFERYPLFREIIGKKQHTLYLENGGFYHTLVNTNDVLGEYGIVGGKTGFTTDAKGCLMVIQKDSREGSYIINIVLGSDDRFGEMKNMIQWVSTAYQWK